MIHPYILDKPLMTLVAKLPSSIAPLMTLASFIAAPPAVAVMLMAVLVVAFFTGNDQLFRAGLITLALSPLAELSKLITRRRRPETLYVENMRFKTYSFPSGHSYISALVFGFLATVAVAWLPYGWWIATLLIATILLVGVSRIYLGAHFPSDVLAGWILGGTIVYFVSKAGQLWQ